MTRKNNLSSLGMALAVALSIASCGPCHPPAADEQTSDNQADTTANPDLRFDPARPWAHDPVLAVEGDTIYAFSTGHGINQMRTVDMKTWEIDGPCLDSLPAWVKEKNPEATMHLWAPDIIFSGGEWHLFFCSSVFATNKSVIGHLTSKTLNRHSKAYGWKDEGLIIQSVPHRDNWNAIDPNVAVCADGSAWMTFGSFWGGIKLVRLRDDLGGLSEPQEWHTIASRPIGKMETAEKPGDAAIEAPFIFKHDGWFFLFVSFDYCCRGEESTYHVVCGRSRDIRGPYQDREGRDMALGGGARVDLPRADDDRYVAAGHCAVVSLRGSDYMAMHAYRRADGHPELILRKIEWDDKGWPVLQGE